MQKSPTFLVIDLFCGAGGVTTGFAMTDFTKIIACVNHDPKAIESHWKNHPEVKHFEEDIRTLDLTELAMHAKTWQDKYPDAKLILWASLECTNFSKAKGGQPRDADSRTLADHLHRYVHAVSPDFVMIENVVEFMSWGPLDENGKPISRHNGEDFTRWCGEMCEHGYLNEWKELNSADFGAYTSRNRLFGAFYRPDLSVVWPQPTHSKKPTELKKWMPVKDVLDFTDEGQSIFTRKKPLSEKTLARIYAGLVKFIANGDKSFMLKYNSTDKNGKHTPPSVNQPCPTIAAQSRLGVVNTTFIQKHYSGKPEGKVTSVAAPCGTITTKANLSLVQTKFLAAYYGNGDNVSPVTSPCPTIPTKDRFQFVNAQPFLMPTSYDNTPKSINEPAPTLQASRRHHYIVNPSHGGHCTSTDAPCPVIVARQDKAPLYVIQAAAGQMQVPVYDTDSPMAVHIKNFMAAFSLVDIKMRMLRVPELLKIQGFPNEYMLAGNQSDQKKFIGNSVVPLVVKKWAEAIAQNLIDNSRTKVA